MIENNNISSKYLTRTEMVLASNPGLILRFFLTLLLNHLFT